MEWEDIKLRHKFWDDAWAGVEWSPLLHITPGEGVEIEWAQESVDVAHRVAQVSGWEAVTWENLLVELISMEDLTE